MRNAIRLSVICVAVMLGCAQPQPVPIDSRASAERPMAWPDDWTKVLGQKVTVDGWAAIAKLGSELYEDKELSKHMIWIDGDGWPGGFYSGPGTSKHVRVTGTVIKREDMPVYMAERGTWPPKVVNGGDFPYRTGIPAYSEEEFERYKSRFLLKDPVWTVINE